MSKRGPMRRYVVTTVTAHGGTRTTGFTSRALANSDYVSKRAKLRDGVIELCTVPDGELLRADQVMP